MIKNIINIGKLLKHFEKKNGKKNKIIYLGFLYFFF